MMKPAWALIIALCLVLWTAVLLHSFMPREGERYGIPQELS